MDPVTVDITYGQALYDAAKDREKIDEIWAEYQAVTAVFHENPSLKKLFMIPTLSLAEKKNVAREIFAERISRELLNFICILINKRRVGAWDGIGRCFERLIDARDGLAKGVVYSVVPISDVQRKALEEQVSQGIGKKVKLENRIDESLLGGISIFVDGRLFDASMKARLLRMKQKMLG